MVGSDLYTKDLAIERYRALAGEMVSKSQASMDYTTKEVYLSISRQYEELADALRSSRLILDGYPNKA